MGHDISAYKKADTERKKEVAYQRYGMSNQRARHFYTALGANDHDCGCSGCGTEQEFDIPHLRLALAQFPAEDWESEREFLEKCIATGEPVIIVFY